MNDELADALRSRGVAAAWLNDVSISDFVPGTPDEAWSLAVLLRRDVSRPAERLDQIAAEAGPILGHTVTVTEHDLTDVGRIGQLFDDRHAGAWDAAVHAAGDLFDERRERERPTGEELVDILGSLSTLCGHLWEAVGELPMPHRRTAEVGSTMAAVREQLRVAETLAWTARTAAVDSAARGRKER